MKVDLYSIDGKKKGSIDLPEQFSEPFRPDLVRRAVLSEESFERQPKGNYVWAGMETSAKYRGRKESYASLKNRGQAKLPREVVPGGWGKVKKIPSAVKGRRAHPPNPEKKIFELMNKKEHTKALRSALSGASDPELVKKRVPLDNPVSPIVVESSVENLKKSKEVLSLLSSLSLSGVVEAARDRKRRRTGVRRKRKSVNNFPKYVLFVSSGESLVKASSNIPGVHSVKVSDLKVKHICPGGEAPSLLILSEDAVRMIGEKL